MVQCHSDDYGSSVVQLIHILLVVYVYDAGNNTFRMLPDMPVGIPVKVHNAKLALRSIAEGQHLLCFRSTQSRRKKTMLHDGQSCINATGPVHARESLCTACEGCLKFCCLFCFVLCLF